MITQEQGQRIIELLSSIESELMEQTKLSKDALELGKNLHDKSISLAETITTDNDVWRKRFEILADDYCDNARSCAWRKNIVKNHQ